MSLPNCLQCGYSRCGLAEGAPCPECGYINGLAKERAAVLAITRSMWTLLFALFNFRKKLPSGWWFALHNESELDDSRSAMKIALAWIALLALVAGSIWTPIGSLRRESNITAPTATSLAITLPPTAAQITHVATWKSVLVARQGISQEPLKVWTIKHSFVGNYWSPIAATIPFLFTWLVSYFCVRWMWLPGFAVRTGRTWGEEWMDGIYVLANHSARAHLAAAILWLPIGCAILALHLIPLDPRSTIQTSIATVLMPLAGLLMLIGPFIIQTIIWFRQVELPQPSITLGSKLALIILLAMPNLFGYMLLSLFM